VLLSIETLFTLTPMHNIWQLDNFRFTNISVIHIR